MRRKDGKIVEQYDEILEYKLTPAGTLTFSTPSFEVREFMLSSKLLQLAYITYPNGKVYDHKYDDSFWDITKQRDTFRFKSVDENTSLDAIRKELLRRATVLESRAEELYKKADQLRSISNLYIS